MGPNILVCGPMGTRRAMECSTILMAANTSESGGGTRYAAKHRKMQHTRHFNHKYSLLTPPPLHSSPNLPQPTELILGSFLVSFPLLPPPPLNVQPHGQGKMSSSDESVVYDGGWKDGSRHVWGGYIMILLSYDFVVL